MIVLAAQSHSLSDVGSLPWWAQFAIGLGLVTISTFGWWVRDKIRDSAIVVAAAFLTGIAGLTVLWSAIF